jgi:DNA-binding winged helix-turn-helix (wHTH) protein/tetratricopeptide (TPR) repeat protein
VRYRFGEFELDTASHQLSRSGEPLSLWPKVFDLLRYLVENPGRLVTKQELLDSLWSDAQVSEGSVPWTISHARRALGQRGGEKRPIETVHGRGYRFQYEVEVLGDRPAPSVAPPAPAAAPAASGPGLPFVGREAVMARLEARLGDAGELSQGGLCLLEGPAGIGKTRCLDELSRRAAAAGFDVWSGRCLEDARAPVYWPWVQVLRGLSRERSGLASRAAELLSELRSAEQREEPSDGDTQGPDAGFWWLDGVSGLLSEAAVQRPTVVLLDDLQWADAASVDLLSFLAPELRRLPLLVVAARRERAPGDAAARRLSRHAERIDLEPLTEADVARYLVLAAAEELAQPQILAALQRATAGNPLFLQHSVRALRARGDAGSRPPPAAEAIEPAAIARETLGAAVERLGDDARELLSIASVLGETVELGALQALTEDAPEALLSELEPAVREGFVVPEDPSTLRFCHGLLRSVLYDALPGDRRAALHRRAAEALEQAGSTRYAEIAHHRYCALSLGEPARVVAAAERAARAAARVQAYADAARYCEWARTAQDQDPSVAPPARVALMLFHAQMCAGVSEHARAREILQQATDLARQHGLWGALTRAARVLRPTHLMGSIEDSFVQTLLEEALQHAPAGEGEMRVSALSQLACMPPYALDIERSKALSEEALSLARTLGDETPLLRALNARLYALSGPDDVEALLQTADEMLEVPAAPRDWVVGGALAARHGALLLRGEMAQAEHAREELSRIALAHGWQTVIWYDARFAVQRDLHRGDFAAAAQGLHALREHGERFRVAHARELCQVLDGVLQLEKRGAASLMQRADLELLRGGLSLAPIGMRPSMTRLLLTLGDPGPARALLDQLAQADFAGVPREIGYLAALCNLGVIAVALGDRPRAERLYALLEPYADFNTPNALFLHEGAVAHFLGLLASYLEMPERSAEHFEQALAMNERIGHRPQLARTCLEYARAVASGGAAERTEARELLARSRALAEEMGMEGLVEQLQAGGG